jgi:hypothetical protein
MIVGSAGFGSAIRETSLSCAHALLTRPASVRRQPKAYGPQRSEAYLPLPKWRRNAKRPSCLDIIGQLRLEMQRQPHKLVDFMDRSSPIALATVRAAASKTRFELSKLQAQAISPCYICSLATPTLSRGIFSFQSIIHSSYRC